MWILVTCKYRWCINTPNRGDWNRLNELTDMCAYNVYSVNHRPYVVCIDTCTDTFIVSLSLAPSPRSILLSLCFSITGSISLCLSICSLGRLHKFYSLLCVLITISWNRFNEPVTTWLCILISSFFPGSISDIISYALTLNNKMIASL